MPLPFTKLHGNRLLNQVLQNLIGLQVDIRQNAQRHRQMALAQSPNLVTLQGFVNDCVAQYQRRQQWLADVVTDGTRRQRLDDALARIGCTEADATDIYSYLNNVISQMAAASKATYADIITLCDNVLANVAMPESLWPE
jgi:hypothetical protein